MKSDYLSLGFETISEDNLSEYRADGIYLRHLKTGAEIYKVNIDDDENLFAAAFRTPPYNHTGVPHILEHTVLCGSRKFPLKDPFLVLLKGSAHTFLNAMTYPDKTVYPVSSTVKTDFINLLRVYSDAVFFPNLKKEAFEQEGHRLELNAKGKLARSGIVLNEMKGSYSSPESIAGDWALRSLFPDTPYRWDSGGSPEHIPELTYDALKAFHEMYYHPSNARIFLYGSHSLSEVLEILDSEFLSHFSFRDISSQISFQKPWTTPQRITAYWPSASDQGIEKKSTISINWLWGEVTKPRQVLEARILSEILLGHSGALLHKAVIESGLGEDLSQISGLESNLRQMVFTIALRGTDPDKASGFEETVIGALESINEELDDELIEGSLRSVEFYAREIRGGTPFGLRLMNRCLKGWLHGKPPRDSLVFAEPMQDLRQRLKKGYFENLIHQNLVDNPHRSTVVIIPDPELGERQVREERIRLDTIQGEMSAEHCVALKESSQNLTRFQEEPDDSEALSCIPILSPEDLPREVMKIPLDYGRSGEVDWYCHEAFTNEISYLGLAFDLSHLDAELQSWMPLFGRTLTDVGLPGMSYEDLAIQLSLKTGSLGCSLEASSIHGNISGAMSRRLFIHLKALNAQWNNALDITLKLLQRVDFSNEKRIDDLILELRNDYRSAIIPSGNMFASLRASAKHSSTASWEDLWYGIGQLSFLQTLVERKDRTQQACRALRRIYNQIIRQNNLSVVITTDSVKSSAIFEDSLKMVATLPLKSFSLATEPDLFRHKTMGESLATASAVSFSALSLPAPILGSPDYAWTVLLAHLLRTGYLWETIRMKGGAYGAHASTAGLEGTFSFSTYRDPLIAESLAAFQDALKWGRNLDEKTVRMAIIATIGKELKPLGPGQSGMLAFKRKLYGIDDAMRQMKRDAQLSATTLSIRGAAETLLGRWENRSITVIADEKALDEAGRACPELCEYRQRLPS